MCTDMELSCDEKVLKEAGEHIRKPYASLLLSLAVEKHTFSGSPLAFGEGNIKTRIQNVLSYKKVSFWLIALSVVVVFIVGFALVSDPKQKDALQPEKHRTENSVGAKEAASGGVKVKIEYFQYPTDEESVMVLETADSQIAAFIGSVLHENLMPAREADFENNHTEKYAIILNGENGEYRCKLYFDTLYDKAFLDKEGDLYAISTDFARYIRAFLENTAISTHMDPDAVDLFRQYGWTLDYQIKKLKSRLADIRSLSGFDPNTYYFAYHNELSRDIGLDMSGYAHSDIDVEIYRIYESMPREFYPIQDCRGIVVRNNGRIIGAFISAGRHSTFNACSLKGSSFEKITGQVFDDWLKYRLQADELEAGLVNLEPEQVLEAYFTALDRKDARTAGLCLSRKTLLDGLSANLPNSELFNEAIALPLAAKGLNNASPFANLKSARLIKSELIDEPDDHTRIFRVTVDLRYMKDLIIASGKQDWDCRMVLESPQTGWKIAGFGH